MDSDPTGLRREDRRKGDRRQSDRQQEDRRKSERREIGTEARFAASHPADRNFFLLFVVLCWLGVLMGFFPAVSGRMQGRADYPAPPILQIHAFAFVGWLMLLTAQMLLIRTARQSVHRQLGLVAFALIPVMVVSGFVSEIYSQRYYLSHPPDSQAFFIIPIWYVIGFGGLAAGAIIYRKEPAAHKRLIVLATTVIVGAAYARWWGDALWKMAGDRYGGMLIHHYTATTLLLLLAMGFDLMTRGTLHRVYRWGVPFIIVGEVATTILYHSPAWLTVARRIVDAFSWV
jgi:uncharacterized membrane protein